MENIDWKGWGNCSTGATGASTVGGVQETGDGRRETVKEMGVRSAKELEVYRKAYELAMAVFEISKRFPPEELFALTSQIRRASRSVCCNLREAWAERRYEPHFVSKLTDCDGEANETDTCLDFARDCGYISDEEHATLKALNAEVCRMLGSMLNNPSPFLANRHFHADS